MTAMPMMMMRRGLLGAAGSLAFLPGARAALSGVALVIGNGGYQWEAPLANPRRDARAVGQLLESLGVRTEVIIDGDRATVLAALASFTRKANGADLALLFFAGHGVQRQNNNWLVPVDADLQAGANAPQQLVAVSQALQAMARAKQRVLVLDACRNDPLAGATADTLGLARIDDSSPGSLFCFATSPGRVALDGTGQNSPFTDALLDHLGTPGLELRQVLTRVRRKVLIATESRQVPWDNSSLTDDVVLREPGLPPVPRPVLALAAPPTRPGISASPPPTRASSDTSRLPQQQPGTTRGGDVAFDPQRFRELPRTQLRARELGIPFPDGVLVQRRDADGQETPFTGSYIRGRNGATIVLLLAYNLRSGKATMVRMTGPSQSDNGKPQWFQWDGDFQDGVLSYAVNGILRRRWILKEGPLTARDPAAPSGMRLGPDTLPDLQMMRFE